ncbi:MAG TPA: proline dehydrogenase family protein [Candidatus Caenarcaniphilales bacterium]|nr:proline dehydrogenase family protein [Candidatus Caenarcaniphilales bacterium]
MRSVLLWMASNAWLRRNVPRLWVARRAVRRFMPGETVEDALRAAERFKSQGLGVLFTHLGENLRRSDEADRTAEHYLSLLDETARRGLDGEPSVKLTQLGLDLDAERTLGHMKRLAEKAAAGATPRTVWIDMEGTAYTEATVALYERLKQDHANIGICLQAYLKRTYSDVQRLLPLEPRIRLVKGAYAEPPEIAYQTRRDVDANFLALSVSMLESVRAGQPLFLGLGTHDVELIRQVREHAARIGLPRDTFDVEMLYGIRSDQQRRLLNEGYRVRVLIAYGEAWYAWYMRRLAERPANVIFALRQLLPEPRLTLPRAARFRRR